MNDQISSNKVLMRRIYEEMWNLHQPAFAKELFAQPEGVQKFVGEFLESFPDLQHTIKGMTAEGDRVAVEFSASGTQSGKWLDFEPTGKQIHYTGVTLARIQENKIVEHHTWWDKAELIEQIMQ